MGRMGENENDVADYMSTVMDTILTTSSAGSRAVPTASARIDTERILHAAVCARVCECGMYAGVAAQARHTLPHHTNKVCVHETTAAPPSTRISRPRGI